MPFDPFRRFRLRSRSVSVHPPSAEEDSDESSPERDQPRIIHVSGPMSDRKSGEPFLVPEHAKSRENTHFALSLDKAPRASFLERPSKTLLRSVASDHPADSVNALRPTSKPTLIRRVTSKLHISIPSRSGSTSALRSRPSTRTLPTDVGPPTQGPRSPRPTIAVSPTLPNTFVSKQHREAALRERGLLPPRKDLSEQEREADERLGCVPSPVCSTFDGSTEAERLKANWLAANRTSESNDSECAPLVPPHLRSAGLSSPSVPLSNIGVGRRSAEGRTDLPSVGRPSICSSAPPLSASSCLEVLHEEPSEQGPVTPPPPLTLVKLPIIISGPLDSPPSPMIVESPVSCTFSSHCPGSTLESHAHAHSSHPPPVPEKESTASRRRTSDSGDRPRRAVGSLSRLGTRSLTNLGRSVTGSMRAPSSSTLASGHTSSSVAQAPRMAIDPTMHSIGSIIRETRDIKDAESRRLSELAFLD